MDCADRLRAEMRHLEQQRDALDSLVQSFRVVIAHLEDGRPEALQPRQPKILANALLGILQAEGRPLHYLDLWKRLVAVGIDVPGADPKRNVGAHLSADTRFKNVSRGMWGLKSWGSSPTLLRAALDGDDAARDGGG